MGTRYLVLTDGTTTLDLAAGASCYLQSYVPRSPDLTTQDLDPGALHDGGERASTTRRNVTESARVLVSAQAGGAPDPAVARAAIRSIEALLRQAEEWQRRRVGAAVYVVYGPQGAEASDLYRSEVLSGRVELSDSALKAGYLDEGLVEILVVWTRRFYWEANSETELSLTNGGGSGTGGQTVYNHDDAGAGHDNYVAIAAGDVAGVLPTPARLAVTNSLNDANSKTRTLWVGHNAFSEPASFAHILEGEDDTEGAVQVDATCSGGNFQRVVMGASEVLLFSWALSTTQLTYCASNWFRVLCRFANLPAANAHVRLKLDRAGAGSTIIWSGPLVNLSDELSIQELGTLQLPPFLTGGTAAACYLQIFGYADSGTPNIDIDFLQLTPLDSYRQFTSSVLYVVYNDRLVDDEPAGYLYVDTPATPANGRQGGTVSIGSQILLWPSRAQRLYFLQRAWTSGAPTDELAAIDRTLTVRVYYRPRRLTI